MAKYKNKLFDSVNGALGPAVVYQMYGKTYVRTKPNSYNDRKTAAQLSQRYKLNLILQFLKPFKEFIRISFATEANGRSAFHAAQSYNMKNGLCGQYPVIKVDDHNALISYGAIALPHNIQVNRKSEGFLFSWETGDLPDEGQAYDNLVVIGFAPYNQTEATFQFTGVQRSEEQYFWKNALSRYNEVKLWIAFQSRDQSRMSNSFFLG